MRSARGWTNVTRPAGSFEGLGTPAARQSGSYTVVSVPLTFQAGDATGRVILGRDGKVTGLVLQPHLETIDSALVMEPPGAGLVAATPA